MVSEQSRIGFIGLGTMGSRMVHNFLAAGHSLAVYDLNGQKRKACVEAGAAEAGSAAEVVAESDCIFTSLPTSEVFVAVAEESLLPQARAGQYFIDVGTVLPQDVRRLAVAFQEKEAYLLDVPVSGGASGAQTGTLRMFAGGDETAYRQVRPLLEVLGDPAYISYCGGSGAGQMVKLVNQMAMGLSAAAHLESIALGVSAGIDADALAHAIGGNEGWRAQFAAVARQVAAGRGIEVGVKFGQLHYFLAEAEAIGLSLPLSQVLYDFCKDGEYIAVEANRQSPSFWQELTKGGDDNQ